MAKRFFQRNPNGTFKHQQIKYADEIGLLSLIIIDFWDLRIYFLEF